MGTNYYVVDETDYCKYCGKGKKEVHLGKSSAGWCFALNVYPEKGINNWADILDYVKDKNIYNEYEDLISAEEFIDVVTNRSWKKRSISDYANNDRYLSFKHFLYLNHAELGPDNLLRHKSSEFCIGHGEGTYDYMVGDFS